MARAKTPDEIQADIDKQKAKLKQLEKKKQLALARQSEADRKRRNHALITWGAWIESACGGDWAGVDSRLLHAMLDRYGNAYRKLNDHPGRSAKDAADELREYERELRNGGKAEASADAAEAGVADAVEDLGEPSHKRGINIEALCGLDVGMDEDD